MEKKANITIKVNQTAESKYYCKLIFENREYTFEEFSKVFKVENLDKKLEKCIIRYRNKDISFNDMLDINKKFNSQLELPDLYHNNLYNIEFNISLSDKDYYVGVKHAEALEQAISKARYWLLMSHEIVLSNFECNWESGYLAQYWLRTMRFESSLLWYNACEDYLLQMIWFSFELYKRHYKYNKNMKYNDLLKLCSLKSVLIILDHNKKSTESKNLVNIIRKYNKNLSELRDWANKLKHRGNLNFKGSYIGNGWEMVMKNTSGDCIFSSKDFEPMILDLDEAIIKLAKIHEEIIKYSYEIINFINFKAAISIKTQDGKIMILDKKQYRKILL